MIARPAILLAAVSGLYFVLAGEVSQAEAIALVPVLLLTLIYDRAGTEAQSVPLRIGLRGVSMLARSVVAIVPELWRVGGALCRCILQPATASSGVVLLVPFRFGALKADDVGRRAAVVTAISLAPNGIALGMAHGTDELIVHQLVQRPLGGDAEWPG